MSNIIESLLTECNNNEITKVNEILKSNPDILLSEYNEDTPLHIACRNNNIELVRLLLDNKGKIFINKQIKSSMNTPLIEACIVKDIDIELISLLLDNGAKETINVFNRENECAVSIINFNTNNNERKESRYDDRYESFNEQLFILSNLQDAGAKIYDIFNNNVELDDAIRGMNIPLATNILADYNSNRFFLYDKQRILNKQICEKLWNLVMEDYNRRHDGDPAGPKYYMHQEQEQEKYNITALHIACMNNVDSNFIKLLLEKGANRFINLKLTKYDTTPLHIICKSKPYIPYDILSSPKSTERTELINKIKEQDNRNKLANVNLLFKYKAIINNYRLNHDIFNDSNIVNNFDLLILLFKKTKMEDEGFIRQLITLEKEHNYITNPETKKRFNSYIDNIKLRNVGIEAITSHVHKPANIKLKLRADVIGNPDINKHIGAFLGGSNNYKEKYLKYKEKYLELKNIK
jgi:ankyrin repeat protein